MNTSSGSNKKQEINFESLAKQVIDEHNKIRTDPSYYIEKLHSCLSYFRGEKLLHKPGEEAIETYEGKPAFEEAIDFLKRQKPIGALQQEERLIKACRDHIADIGPAGLASHESSDGRNVSDRIETVCGSCVHCWH